MRMFMGFAVVGLALARPADVSLTLDPMFLFDGQVDSDLLTTTKVSDGGWGILVGARAEASVSRR